MVNKKILGLAIAAASLGLAGCNISSSSGNSDVNQAPIDSGAADATPSQVASIFSAGNSDVPVNSDLLFAQASTTDGTAETDDTTPPVTTAISKLTGFSTTASFYLPFNGALDADSVVAGQTVFLIELKSNEDDSSIDSLDVSTIVAANPTNPFAEGADQLIAADYAASYVELEDGSHAIQVTPLKPLDEKTKYIVAVTSGVTDTAGVSVAPSAEYDLLAGDLELPSDALAPVRTAIQAWEGLAGAFLTAASGGALSQDNVIFTQAFTTDGSLGSLKSYAAPALFVADNLSLESAEDLVDSFASEEFETTIEDVVARMVAVELAGGDYETNPTLLFAVDDATITAVKALDLYPGLVYGAIASADIGSLLGSDAEISLEDLSYAPAPRDVGLVDGTTVDGVIYQALGATTGASPATLGTGTSTTTRYYQGKIALPNFLDLPELTTEYTAAGISAAMAADADWSANANVGAVLDSALGNAAGTTPPTDADGSTNVTWRYPFPAASEENSGMNQAPLLVTVPDSTACGGATEVPVVIYVHGITGSRANSVAYSAALADQCVATVAIDLPVHGIAPITSDSNGNAVDNSTIRFSMDASQASYTGSPWAAAIALSGGASAATGAAERHGNIWQDSNGIRWEMDFDGGVETEGTDGDVAAGTSGSTFINLSNFTRTRDNVRQAVADLLNVNASLGNISDAVAAQPTGVGFDLDRVYLAGHSLGAIVATTYAAVNNDAAVLAANDNLSELQGVILANGGAHLTKLLDNSPAFGPTISGALAASGIAVGTSNYEKYMYVFQSAVDVIDPANAAATLAATDTPVLLFNMVGGNTLPTDASGISLPDGFKLAGMFPADHTVPNFDYFYDNDTNPYAAYAPALGLTSGLAGYRAPMAGTDGLAALLGLETVDASTDTTSLSTPLRAQTRFATGTHATFANADSLTAFAEMVTESVLMINGAFGTVNTSVLESN